MMIINNGGIKLIYVFWGLKPYLLESIAGNLFTIYDISNYLLPWDLELSNDKTSLSCHWHFRKLIRIIVVERK